MSPQEFGERLAAEGFGEIVTVEREAGSMGEHAHPFEAKALIVAGEIAISIAGSEQVFGVGDVFHLPAGMPHAERYGPGGVRYLVGRRQG